MKKPTRAFSLVLGMGLFIGSALISPANASSHREAPLISNDPLADNTDLYAFRSPDNPNTITIIANYIPTELPYGGPNYHSFGENIRYEIHIDNDISTAGDDIIYRFTFHKENEDPTTFFNIRLGAQTSKQLTPWKKAPMAALLSLRCYQTELYLRQTLVRVQSTMLRLASTAPTMR